VAYGEGSTRVTVPARESAGNPPRMELTGFDRHLSAFARGVHDVKVTPAVPAGGSDGGWSIWCVPDGGRRSCLVTSSPSAQATRNWVR
jgi:hypothetical protein